MLLLFRPSSAGAPTFVVAWAEHDEVVRYDMKKNVASQSIGCQMVSATDGSAFTNPVSVFVTGDNGTQSSGGGTAPAHEGNGYHSYTPTQAETNYNHIAFTFTGSGAVPRTVQVFTTFPQTGDAYAELTNGTYGLSAIETLVDDLESRIGTPSNLGSGATVAANLVDIEAQTDDIGIAGAGLTSIPYTGPSAATVADAVWDEDATAHQTGGTFGQAIGDPGADANTIYGAVVTGATGATIAADIVTIDGIVDSILADTDAIEVDTQDIQARLPAALVGGRIDASVGAMAANTVTASAIATDAIDSDAIAASAVTEIQAGLSTHSAADVWAVGTRSLTDKANFTLAASEHTSIAAAAWAYVVEGAMTAVQWSRVVLAAVAGKSNSHESGTPKYRDQADTKNRIDATTDANGNRTSVTVDGT